jgi:hypothetical protein
MVDDLSQIALMFTFGCEFNIEKWVIPILPNPMKPAFSMNRELLVMGMLLVFVQTGDRDPTGGSGSSSV